MRPLSNRARDAEGDGRKPLPSVSPKDRARSKPGASRKGSVRPKKESAGKIPDIIDNNFRSVSIGVDFFGRGDAGEDEDGVHFGFNAGKDVGVHAVADDGGFFADAAEFFQGGAHHQRIRFADKITFFSGGRLDRFEKRELPITIFSPRAPVSDTKTD